MEPSKAPEVIFFKRFQGQWSNINPESYDNVFSDDFASSELADIRDEVIEFCEKQLLDHQPRDDYRELLMLMLVFLGRKIASHEKFQST